MSGPFDEFTTGVRSADGRWPSLPVAGTFSSLHEVGQCPRRGMLSWVTYPDL